MGSIVNTAEWLEVWTNVVEPTLSFTVGSMRLFGGLVRYIPRPLRSSARRVAIATSELVNKRPILDPMIHALSSLATLSVTMSDRPQDRDAVELFFRLGLRVGDDHYFGSRLGSGITSDADNCFVPDALAAGPDQTASPAMASQQNAAISKTCAFLSMLSYRSDDDILRCIIDAVPPMLPRVALMSVHTHQEGDLSVFVAEDQPWAVFCFRGTEGETLRDWLTSVLLNPTVFFASGSREGGGTGRCMTEAKVRDRYFKQMLLACRDSTLQMVTDTAGLVPPGASISAFDLVNYLQRQGYKIYYTGHSLGGGLTTLFGASMQAWGLSPTAVVSFGSPPVGDENFCQWFNANVPVSWRFVNEDEFAPMAPPLPFTEPTEEQELRHVGGLIKVENMMDRHPDQMTPDQMDKRLRWLQQHDLLSNIVLDHNPALTLFALQKLGNK